MIQPKMQEKNVFVCKKNYRGRFFVVHNENPKWDLGEEK
jgi:hypothetical protein